MIQTALRLVAILCFALFSSLLIAKSNKKPQPAKKPAPQTKTKKVTTTRKSPAPSVSKRSFTPSRRKRVFISRWSTPSFADSTAGDSVDGEDLTVRRAAVEALGPYNGTVVVSDPNTGRVLTIVNQKLALSMATTPCSTIKLISGLAGIVEGTIEQDTYLKVSRRESMNLSHALAVSNNPFFQKIGYQIGFDKLKHYARMFGLGERAGVGIDGESPGKFPEQPETGIPVGLMCSHGSAIEMTPLQLTAIINSIANGGTLYWLQYPHNEDDARNLVPKVKRYLDDNVREELRTLRPGMLGATEFGSGRRAAYSAEEPIFGKTGTCSDGRTHLGWFGSYNEVNGRKLVVTVLLTGGRSVAGPVAAGVAGQVFRNLSSTQYFSQVTADSAGPAALISRPAYAGQR